MPFPQQGQAHYYVAQRTHSETSAAADILQSAELLSHCSRRAANYRPYECDCHVPGKVGVSGQASQTEQHNYEQDFQSRA
jgi:hypothetical protein